MFLADSYINLWTSPSADSDIVNKAKNPISFDDIDYNSEEVEKLVLSKKTPYEDKIRLVTNKVLFVLNKWVGNVEVITTKEDLKNYLDCCVENNLVAIDTETNNSLDPLTCKIMGLCLYTPNKKPAYVPINHCDFKTKAKLKKQLSEIDIKNGLEYLISKRNNQSVFIFFFF